MDTTNLVFVIIFAILLVVSTALAGLARHWPSLGVNAGLGYGAARAALAGLDMSASLAGDWVLHNVWLLSLLCVVVLGMLAIRGYGETEEVGTGDARHGWLRRLAGAEFALVIVGLAHLITIGSIWLFSYV